MMGEMYRTAGMVFLCVDVRDATVPGHSVLR